MDKPQMLISRWHVAAAFVGLLMWVAIFATCSAIF